MQRTSLLVVLNWIQSSIIPPLLPFIPNVYESDNGWAQGICCVGGYIVVLVLTTVSLIFYMRRRTWESLAFGCFFYWIPPVWLASLGFPLFIVLALSIIPIATIIFMILMFFKSMDSY